MIPNTDYNRGAALFDKFVPDWFARIDLTWPAGAQIQALVPLLPAPYSTDQKAYYGLIITPGSNLEINWAGNVAYKQEWAAQTIRCAQRETSRQDDLGFGQVN